MWSSLTDGRFVKLAAHTITRFAIASFAALMLATSMPLFAPPLVAQQVGYSPEQSPYRDLVWSQHLTLYGGYYAAHADAVGAAPGSAPMLGLRYELDIAGPAQFFVRAARVSSKRNAFDPTLPQSGRSLGEASAPLLLADAGFSFNLTGRKSWHSIVPVFGFGLGIASSTKQVPNDPYKLGTQFAFSTQLGIRVVPNRHYELRFMVDNMFYQNHFPASYYAKSADTTSVVPSSVSKSSYLANTALTAGISIPLFK
jgi:hypothetical protein